MLRLARTYADAISAFRWEIPARYNIGVDVVDKHVAAGHGGRLALIHESENGAVRRFSFDDLPRQSNRLPHLLVAPRLRPRARVDLLPPHRAAPATRPLAGPPAS